MVDKAITEKSSGVLHFAESRIPQCWNAAVLWTKIHAPYLQLHIRFRYRNTEPSQQCLPDSSKPVSPKPDSPKLGFRVRVNVSANRDWTFPTLLECRIGSDLLLRETSFMICCLHRVLRIYRIDRCAIGPIPLPMPISPQVDELVQKWRESQLRL